MSENRVITSPAERHLNGARVMHPATQLTGADYEAVGRELDALRRRHRVELERRLRDARAFGSPADDDDVLAVFEDVAYEQARIAQLEALLRSASIVDGHAAFDGRAGLGCTVRVAERDRSQTDYVLVGRRDSASSPQHVSSASPVGMALLGACAGDVVDVALPNGRHRSLEVLAVEAHATDAGAALVWADARSAGKRLAPSEQARAWRDQQRLVISRVAPEALTNVVRHADANRVELSLERRSGLRT